MRRTTARAPQSHAAALAPTISPQPYAGVFAQSVYSANAADDQHPPLSAPLPHTATPFTTSSPLRAPTLSSARRPTSVPHEVFRSLLSSAHVSSSSKAALAVATKPCVVDSPERQQVQRGMRALEPTRSCRQRESTRRCAWIYMVSWCQQSGRCASGLVCTIRRRALAAFTRAHSSKSNRN